MKSVLYWPPGAIVHLDQITNNVQGVITRVHILPGGIDYEVEWWKESKLFRDWFYEPMIRVDSDHYGKERSEVDHAIGDIVFLRLASERIEGLIIGICIPNGRGILYTVAWGDCSEHNHYGIELATEYEAKWSGD